MTICNLKMHIDRHRIVFQNEPLRYISFKIQNTWPCTKKSFIKEHKHFFYQHSNLYLIQNFHCIDFISYFMMHIFRHRICIAFKK